MKIMLVNLSNANVPDVGWGIVESGNQIVYFDEVIPNKLFEQAEIDRVCSAVETRIRETGAEACFTWNYSVPVSDACEMTKIPYLSWSFDSPSIDYFSKNMYNKCNYFFFFDKAFCAEVKAMGIEHAYYLPLAVNSLRLSNTIMTDDDIQKYQSDVCFLGNFYEESFYNDFEKIMPDSMKNVIEEIFCKQINNWDVNYIDLVADSNLIDKMQKMLDMGDIRQYYPNVPPKFVYSDLVIGRKFTNLERNLIIQELAEHFPVTVYTESRERSIPNVIYHDGVDYFSEMPIVFYASKINLNMTTRSIRSGVPLRVFDIMGVAGFALTNYQSEMDDLFDTKNDLAVYHSIEEMEDLISFYMTHEKERVRILANGYKKVHAEHNYKLRVQEMLGRL